MKSFYLYFTAQCNRHCRLDVCLLDLKNCNREIWCMRKTTDIFGLIVESWAYVMGQNTWLCNLFQMLRVVCLCCLGNHGCW
jgi:hypothetical protein